MTYEQFKERCLKYAIEKGCDAAEVYAMGNNGFAVSVLEGEIIRYEVSNEGGLNLRVLYDGKNGYAYTELFEDPETLVEHAIDNAKAIDSTDVNPMQGGGSEYPSIDKTPNPIVHMTEDEKINIALNLERDTKAFDDRVNRMADCAVMTGVMHTYIANTRGLDVKSENEISYAIAAPILRQGDDEHMSYSFKFGHDITDYNSIIKESVDNALMQFNAKTVDSGEYRILIRNDAASSLLMAFSGMFSADSVQKGLSLLAGQLNKPIASEVVSIVDDPLEKDFPRAFDAEGVPSVATTVIENGVLKSYLHNLRTALKDGVSSTSNASRRTPASPVDIAPSNFYIVKGEKSFDELVAELDKGLIITDFSGLHAGINPVSGDFSLIAKGLLVDGGSVIRSVDQITCAGNFLQMIKDIIAVGSDLRFGPPMGSRVGTPSLLIEKLVVSGK
ncbi:MAG: TldD/PmbA family protein [Clostridia bacterium]|nr:TldD/PmbA family protein [Clostridia bacterium]